jgi:hypothetical protein
MGRRTTAGGISGSPRHVKKATPTLEPPLPWPMRRSSIRLSPPRFKQPSRHPLCFFHLFFIRRFKSNLLSNLRLVKFLLTVSTRLFYSLESLTRLAPRASKTSKSQGGRSYQLLLLSPRIAAGLLAVIRRSLGASRSRRRAGGSAREEFDFSPSVFPPSTRSDPINCSQQPP